MSRRARARWTRWTLIPALTLMLGGVAGGCAAPPSGDGRPAPNEYRCPRAAAPPVIDGRLDDPAWRDAPWTETFIDIEGDVKPAPRFRTRAKMTWDERFLYVAALMEEPHVWATLRLHDSIVFRDNDFEVFIDPDGDELDYYEIEINALGTIFDLMLDKPYRAGGQADHDWNMQGLRTGVHVDGTLNDPSDVDRGWSVELAMPWEAFAERGGMPVPPRAGDVWRVNFSRVQWRISVDEDGYHKVPDRPEDNWVWSPQYQINMHAPEHWGFVEFVEQTP